MQQPSQKAPHGVACLKPGLKPRALNPWVACLKPRALNPWVACLKPQALNFSPSVGLVVPYGVV